MTLRLPKLLDDGCVLQAGVDMHIWGTGDPGRIVLTRLADERHMVQVKDDGTWNAPYGPIEAGGPYELTICYEDGAERISRQCYAGEVFLCSGQSNMELPMAWVRADYPQEWDRDPDPLLRQYKVIPDYDSKVLATITTVRSGRAVMRIRLMISQRSHIFSVAGSASGSVCPLVC